MTRILFVDDEPGVLEGLQNALRKKRKVWHMEFVTRAKEALERLSDGFDVLVTDMRMPEMDGNELLAAARTHHPRIVRFLLTGHAEKQQLLRALPTAHRILIKPVEASVLVAAIEHAQSIRFEVTDPEIENVIGGLDALPVPPTVHAELSRIFSAEHIHLAEVVDTVERDVFALARILQIGNAAAEAGGIDTVAGAIECLGVEPLRGLIADHGLFDGLAPEGEVDGFSVETLDARSYLASRIATDLVPDPRLRESAKVAGMLHDLGQYVMAVYLPGRFRQARNLAQISDLPLHEAERRIFGATHAEIGAHLLSRWNLPPAVVKAVRWHHRPHESHETELGLVTAVHVAATLAESIVGNAFRSPPGMPMRAEALAEVHLEQVGVFERVEEWKQEAARLAEHVLQGAVHES